MTGLPLVFLDVDGPVIPFGGANYPQMSPAGPNPLLARINPSHGHRLAALPAQLVWATGWTAEANTEIAPRLGLPALPVVDWPDGLEDPTGLHWKTRRLVKWAAGRPFVWIDDEISERDRIWVAQARTGPALLHRVDPRVGLRDGDFTTIHEWLTATIGPLRTGRRQPG
jgi:HAD domain in Swiss Army Knife RNA repair proteins